MPQPLAKPERQGHGYQHGPKNNLNDHYYKAHHAPLPRGGNKNISAVLITIAAKIAIQDKAATCSIIGW